MHGVESAQDTAQRLYHGVSHGLCFTGLDAKNQQHVPLAMAQTGNDLGLFKILCAQPDKEWSIDDLANNTSSDPVLLRIYTSTSHNITRSC